MHTLKVLLVIHAYLSIANPQGAYKIVLKRLEVVQQNEDVVRTDVTMTRINRHTIAFNMHFEVKAVLPKTKITIRLYEFLNNEYRPFAIYIERNLCDFLEMEYKSFLYPDMVRIGAFMFEPKCPVLKGNYSFENYTVSTRHFPAGLPFQNGLGELKIINGTTADDILYTLRAYFIVDRDVIFRERYS